METANQSLQQKFDASFAAQGDMEEQMEAANDLIDRLRHNLDDVDRQLRQQQRRYADQVRFRTPHDVSLRRCDGALGLLLQEKAFEAERTVHQAEQNHLVQRIKSLTTERIARPSEEQGDRSAATAALHEELVTLSASHQTLVAQLTTLADEMHEVKAENSRLQEENESWQLLIEERTLAGHMRGGLIPGLSTSPPPGDGAITPSSIRRKECSALETLEEQLEMDELHSELDAQQPIFEESDRALLRVTSGGSYNIDITSPTRPNGNSLATELSAGISMVEMESLRSEIKTLKEANKALSLYCSKILDRIIASEGFEHILSVDYRTRRGARTLAAANGKSRPSVLELAKDMEENGPPHVPESLPPAPSKDAAPVPREAPAPRARPQSMYVTSAVASPPAAAVPAPTASKSPVNPPIVAGKAVMDNDKRARRGFSIDFRSLGFGAQEKPETKPQLKPLQLASRATPAGQNQSPPKATPSPVVALGPSIAANVNGPAARKLAPQEEDEEDRRERSRMEANLKLMGITSPASDAGSHDDRPTPSSGVSAAAGWLSRRLSRASVPAVSPPAVPEGGQRGSTTPLTRLSAALSDSPSSSRLDLEQDPEAALRAYDAREREQARLLAEGKSPTAFTAPPKITRRNRSSAGSTLSRNSAQSFTMSASVSPSISVGSVGSPDPSPGIETIAEPVSNGSAQNVTHASHHRARESVSTLWSMGSSHDHDDK